MSYKDLGPTDFKNGLATEADSVLLDVRTEAEFAEGHIPGAINMDVQSFDFQDKIEKLDKSKNYYINCRSGGRSAMACQILGSKGFTGNLYNLQGGIMAWSNHQFEIES